MIGRLNHVGIAVPSIEDAKETYRALYGIEASAITETRAMEAQGLSERGALTMGRMSAAAEGSVEQRYRDDGNDKRGIS